jgi:formamidopyrimidine-DNA glycosylase
MPELPEVTTIVNQLKESLVGKTISGIDVRLAKSFIGQKEQVLGSKILDIRRRAKMIIIKLDNDKNLVVHLKMTGQLIYGESRNEKAESRKSEETLITFPDPIPFAGTTLPGKTTHVVFTFNDGSKLFFNDMRQFGWVRVATEDELRIMNYELGIEALSPEFTPEYLAKICENWGRPIKLLLLEQKKIAGIGNIYANEALWYAGISPMKRGRELTNNQVTQLHKSIKEVLEMGIKYHGSSAGDEAYVDAFGKAGEMQNHTVVYQKAGSDCLRCHHKIVRSTIGGRGTFFCPKCQS